MSKINNVDLCFLSLVVNFELESLSFNTIQHEQGLEIFLPGIPRCHRSTNEVIIMR